MAKIGKVSYLRAKLGTARERRTRQRVRRGVCPTSLERLWRGLAAQKEVAQQRHGVRDLEMTAIVRVCTLLAG